MPDEITPTTIETPVVETPAAPPAVEPKKSSLLSNILGLVSPEEVNVKPDPVVVAKAEPIVETKPDPVVEKKPVPVKRREAPPAAPAITPEETRRIVAEEVAKATPKPVVSAPTVPDDSDLAPEERDELELALLAEAKDPAKKGLAEKFRKFYPEQKKFLEARMETEGDDYDPAQDPEYKKFVAKHEPKLTSTERKALREDRIANEASIRATKAAEEKFAPEIERLRAKTLEIEHRPKIDARVDKYVGEVASGMPDEIVKFYNENGRSAEKTREAFPDEWDVVVQSVNGAMTLAKDALSLRRGLIKFDRSNERHVYLDTFIDRQAKAVLASPADDQVRGGKTFVHPYQYTDQMAEKHWTFDDEDLLETLKSAAQKEAQVRIQTNRDRLKLSNAAVARRSAAPVGASPAVAPTVTPSTRTPPSPAVGAGTPATKSTSRLSAMLGLG